MDNFDIYKKTLEELRIEFLNDNGIIINNNSDKYLFRNNNINKLLNTKKCFYKDCNNSSIKKSHTIQENGSLNVISENGQLFTPEYREDNDFIMKQEGIGRASTFPGFCEEHEKLFQVFEQKKSISNEYDIVLQLYRTLAKETIIYEHNLKEYRKLKNKYIEFRDNKLTDLIKIRLKENGFINPNLTLKSFKFRTNDNVLENINKEISKHEDYLSGFLEKYEIGVLKDLKKKKLKDIYCIPTLFDVKIPLAMAGYVTIGLHIRTKTKIVDLLVNVVPFENSSIILLSTLKKNKEVLDKIYGLGQLNIGINMISAIESFMINDTDNWFISPSVWNKIDDKFKNEILIDMLEPKRIVPLKYRFSIFNDIRKEIISKYEGNSELTSNLKRKIIEEKRKLTFANTQ